MKTFLGLSYLILFMLELSEAQSYEDYALGVSSDVPKVLEKRSSVRAALATKLDPNFWPARGRRSGAVKLEGGPPFKHRAYLALVSKEKTSGDLKERQTNSGEEGPFWANRGRSVNEDDPFWANRGRDVNEEGPFWANRGRDVNEEGPFWANRGRDVNEEGPFWANRGRSLNEEDPFWANRGRSVNEEGPFWANRGRSLNEEDPFWANRGRSVNEEETDPFWAGRGRAIDEQDLGPIYRNRDAENEDGPFWANRGRGVSYELAKSRGLNSGEEGPFWANRGRREGWEEKRDDDAEDRTKWRRHRLYVEEPGWVWLGRREAPYDVSLPGQRAGSNTELNDLFWVARGKKHHKQKREINCYDGKFPEQCWAFHTLHSKRLSNSVLRELSQTKPDNFWPARGRRTNHFATRALEKVNDEQFWPTRGKKSDTDIQEKEKKEGKDTPQGQKKAAFSRK